MINNKIRNLAPIVKHLLEEYPETRNSDNELYIKYLESKGLSGTMPIAWVLARVSLKELASIESVGRCRRKCQELYPELRADIEVRRARIDNEEPFEDFAQDKRI